jgi:NADH dehydrogenase (ubiquinone) 1 alpha subcomplex subunit 6
MYSLNMPVSAIRTKVRQEFEKHRYVKQLSAVDVLLFQSHAEFQVSDPRQPDEEKASYPASICPAALLSF